MPLEQIPVGVTTPVLSGVVYATPSIPVTLSSGAAIQFGPTISGPFATYTQNSVLERAFIKPSANTTVLIKKLNTFKKSLIPYSALILQDNPSYYWRLNEASGLVAADSVGGAHGTISGGVTLGQAGALSDDKGMTFNGTTGKIVTAGNVIIPPIFSTEFWMKGLGGQVWGTKTSDPTRDKIAISCGDYAVTFVNYANGAASASSCVAPTPGSSDGNWHHIAVVCPGGLVINTYMDGVLTPPAAPQLTLPLVGSQVPIEIGYSPSHGSFMNGSIDEIAIYPYALTPQQILNHYKARLATFSSSPYAQRVIADGASNYWRLGETSGLVATDLIGGANGTISGGVTLGAAGALSDGDKAMTFNVSTGQILMPAIALATTVTVELWFKATATAVQHGFWGNDTAPATTDRVSLYLQPNPVASLAIYIQWANGSPAPTAMGGVRQIGDGQWHHWVTVFAGTQCNRYVDGVLDSTTTLPQAVAWTTGPVLIGHNIFGSADGALDEVAIYPRALTAQEILDHYNLGKKS